MHITVLGATGGIGRAVTTELADRGHTVTAASRSVTPGHVDGIRMLPTDLNDPVAARAACADADVVVMAAAVPYSRWSTELTGLVDAAIDAAATAGARLVMVDNLYAYGAPDGPISERTPQAPVARKGVLRAAICERLLAAHAAGRVRVTIGQLSDYYGPDGGNSLVGSLAVDRVIAGKPPRAYLDADQPHTFAYLPDVARGIATLVENPEADGRAWILPAAPAITQRELLGMISGAAGLDGRIGRISPAMLAMAGVFDRDLREARELTAQFQRPWLIDASAFEATFGPIELTPHDEAARRTVAGARARAGAGTPTAG